MLKSILSFSLLLFSISLFAQQPSRQMIDEYGIDYGKPYLESENPLIESVNWTAKAPAPNSFGRAIVGAIGDYVYVFCSQGAAAMASAYHVPTNTWVASTPATDDGYNSSYCVASGEIFKLSGTSAINTFESFKPTTGGAGQWSVLNPTTTDIMNAQSSMAWDGNDFIYAHSSNYSTSAPASYFSRYTISQNTWTALTPVTAIKRYGGLVYIDGFIYLIGGLVPTGEDQTSCFKYDVAAGTWSPIASLPEPVNFCKWQTTVINSKVVLVGSGGGYSPYAANQKIFIYDPVTNQWTYDSDVPALRGLSMTAFIPSLGRLFYGGGNTGGSGANHQPDIWIGEGGFVPVELTSFSASVISSGVALTWTTATETNNSHFIVERSADGSSFTEAGIVEGSGTTTENKAYTFFDPVDARGILYYRLKQVDYDGSFEYSNVIEVSFIQPLEFALEQNYPNPFNPSTKINFSLAANDFVTLKIFDVLGNEVALLLNENKEAGNHTIEFSGNNLSSGIYLYKISTSSGFSAVKKMQLMK